MSDARDDAPGHRYEQQEVDRTEPRRRVHVEETEFVEQRSGAVMRGDVVFQVVIAIREPFFDPAEPGDCCVADSDTVTGMNSRYPLGCAARR